jgi:hypothetical protein
MPGLRSRTIASSQELSALITREADNIRAGSFCLLGARWPKPRSIPPDPKFWRIDLILASHFRNGCLYLRSPSCLASSMASAIGSPPTISQRQAVSQVNLPMARWGRRAGFGKAVFTNTNLPIQITRNPTDALMRRQKNKKMKTLIDAAAPR